jgi:hypothetical protein
MCDCIKMTNEVLNPRGLQLALAFMFSPESGSIKVRLYIPTEETYEHARLRKRGQRKMQLEKIIVNYCPFCGEKQEPLETKPASNKEESHEETNSLVPDVSPDGRSDISPG